MTLDIPPGATVQIFVGGPPAQFAALPATGEATSLMSPAIAAPRRPLLKFAGVGVLVAAAFLGGQAFHPGSRTSLAAAGALSAPSAFASPPTAPGAYLPSLPDRVGPTVPTPPEPDVDSQIPPAFARQLQQPPVITPPPGAKPIPAPAQAAASGAPAQHPFGLED